MAMIELLVLLAVFAILANSRAARGAFGEFAVNLSARLFLNHDHYAVIPNVTLPVAEGTSQIDHVIISEYGVFVIETKTMSGWIYGSEKDDKWMQVLYRYKKRFQNPLRQNYAHVCALAEALSVSKDKIFPIVVFAGNATFKTPKPANVFYGGQYIRYIKSKTQKVLSRTEVLDLIVKVFDRRLVPGWRTRRRHIENLKKRFGA